MDVKSDWRICNLVSRVTHVATHDAIYNATLYFRKFAESVGGYSAKSCRASLWRSATGGNSAYTRTVMAKNDEEWRGKARPRATRKRRCVRARAYRDHPKRAIVSAWLTVTI